MFPKLFTVLTSVTWTNLDRWSHTHQRERIGGYLGTVVFFLGILRLII
jgi:hypothetical protein